MMSVWDDVERAAFEKELAELHSLSQYPADPAKANPPVQTTDTVHVHVKTFCPMSRHG
jgi:hypothetical protein